METDGRAWFVVSPRRLEELRTPHLLDEERPFRIVGKVRLSGTDYENLCTDLLVEREYLEAYENACRMGDVYDCVYVCRQGQEREGLLIVPDSGGFIRCAAYFRKE